MCLCGSGGTFTVLKRIAIIYICSWLRLQSSVLSNGYKSIQCNKELTTACPAEPDDPEALASLRVVTGVELEGEAGA